MQTNLLWTGLEYYSLENCLVDVTSTGSEINSTILGYHENRIYKVEYHIRTNQNWETVFFEINTWHNNHIQKIRCEGDGKGNWINNGKRAIEFNGCIDIDIPLTPFTNTLPIRRLNLAPNQAQEIQVIYCDLLKQQIKSVNQRYICISKTEFRYENVPNDFEATIQVDEFGFVIDYPQLFVRTAALETNYH